MLFRQLFDKDTSTYTYLLADEVEKVGILIDPVLEQVERDVALVEELGIRVAYVFDTHVHADHVTGAALIRERLGAQSVIAAEGHVREADIAARDGDELLFGGLSVRVMETPGHTDSCLSYYVREADMVFTGDALMIRGCGRTDFQQGSAHKLFSSVRGKLFALPDDTVVYPGHDYKGRTESSIAEEKAENPRLGLKVSESEFVDIMHNLHLAEPKRLREAVPANQVGGAPDVDHTLDGELWSRPDGIKEATPNWVVGHRDRVKVIDVRGDNEFHGMLGHIEEAESVPLDVLASRAGTDWPNDGTLVVVCHSGRRSVAGARKLKEMGYDNVVSMAGGMLRWSDEGRSVARYEVAFGRVSRKERQARR